MSATKAAARPGQTLCQAIGDPGAPSRAGDLDGFDLMNLAEETEGLGRIKFAGLVSALRVVLLQMLTFDRQRMPRAGAEPSEPKGRLDAAVAEAYRRARHEAYAETGLAFAASPEACPYSLAEIMNRPFALTRDA